MDDSDLLVSLVENIVKIVVEVVRNLKIKQVKQHCYRPQLKEVESNKLKDNRAGVKKNKHETFIHYQKSAQGDNPKRQYNLGLCYQYEANTDKGEKRTFELDLRNTEVIVEESGNCHNKVVENELVVVMDIDGGEIIVVISTFGSRNC
ncbi:hypothetical protein C2G38_2209136 [Gigaspora rosea]|uniref:Uncharacterized protein n=1 Tax=Gigaspora rosea TaxID=44941 RepID=A0A397UJG0_9GLOM|nr:hypothetical protein C2G38_2209136 [Gigaspora rosea]